MCSLSPLVIPQTKSQQIVQYLEEQFRSGRLKPGDRLQTVRELAAMFEVSSFVINTAYNELETRGLIERRGRRGVFVRDPQRSGERFLAVEYRSSQAPESMIPQVMRAFEKTCLQARIELDWIHEDFLRGGDPKQVLAWLRERAYCGAVLPDSYYLGNEPELELLRQLEIPVLLPHGEPRDRESTGFWVMTANRAEGWREAIRHLYQQGYRRLGTLAADRGAPLRCGSIEAHHAMMREAGFEPLEDCVCPLPYDQPEAFRAGLARWLGERPRFDAILCFSDFYALRLYQYCQEVGLRIPEDLAVMGYCGYPGCEQLSPPLSTIDQKTAENGRKAAEILIRAARSSGPTGSRGLITASHRLLARESTRRTSAKLSSHFVPAPEKTAC